MQNMKARFSEDHLMHNRVKNLSSGRLKRSSFVLESRALLRKHQDQLPAEVEPFTRKDDPPPWKTALNNVSIRTTVPHYTTKDEHCDASKKALTMAMLDETYPQEAWIRAYTDGSATDAVRRGGAGAYIQYPGGK